MTTKDIKHSKSILDALSNKSLFLAELSSAVSIDTKSLQNSLAKLQKLGLIEKDRAGRWQKI